jgi:two-component system phosphoglycerate transport system response regulator PgtA
VGKILIVEDDEDLVETYTDLLELHHHSVVSVTKALDAISMITRYKPTVVLLDLNLAGYPGTVVINTIRSYQPLKDTKIVVITGHPELLKDRRDFARVDLILSKPISNELLIATIDKFCPEAS